MTTKCSWGNLTMWHPLLALLPLQFDQEENIPGHSIEKRTYRFILKIARMINTFIIVKITITYETWLIG